MSAFLRVVSPGLQTTVQDLGRPGYAHLGVSASGCADNVSARIANRLVGNRDDAALLEMTLLGGDFEFGCDSLVALAGADFLSSLEGELIAPYLPFHVAAGKTLHCGAAKDGARCYLAVAGGFDIARVLGSASTHVMSGVGGFQGRALRHGDLLPLQPKANQHRSAHSTPLRLQRRISLRVTPGPQQRMFGNSGFEALCSQTFSVTENSNRVGLRLHGDPITGAAERMLTEGAALGAIQIPPEGEPIILFVEHQTTGGYPKIANVIAADLPSVGQLRPRDEVRLELVTVTEAREILRQQEHDLDQAIPPQ